MHCLRSSLSHLHVRLVFKLICLGIATHRCALCMPLQDYLRRQNRTANVKVDAYLFAPPNAGDSTWAAGFNQLVNARR
jgi:hypothetical protein